MVRMAKEYGLKEPVFHQNGGFKTTLFRPVSEDVTGEADGGVSGEATMEVKKLVPILNGELMRKEIQEKLFLKMMTIFAKDTFSLL